MALAVAAMALHDHRQNAAAPIVAYGDDAVVRVPAHVAAAGARRVLLVCGRHSFDASGAGAMLPELTEVAEVRRWSEFDPNTDSADVRRGLAVMHAFNPDLVLGVGGGSAMDMAKLLCAFRNMPDERVLDSIRAGHRTDSRREKLFLVPTTSGSGAEATHFAVVYIGHDKYSIGGDGMRPDAIVLDPALSVSGSAYQRATSGIDAVCQAIESMWATGATDHSRHFARVALRMLLPAIEAFVNGHDRESAREMCIGSHFAGRAIDISRTTAAHALSYGITKTCGISHGHAVAMTLGSFLEAHAEATPDELRDEIDPATHAAAMAEVLFALRADSGADAGRRFVKLMESIGLNPSLAAAGAGTSAERRRLAAAVNAERLGNNPVPFTLDELATIVDGVE
jgi:alcohol dehydrogenase class IV